MCKLPEKGQQALKLYVPFNIKEVKRELIFLSPLHCIKKNTHPCKTLSLRVQKTGNAPRVLRHRGCNLSASQPLVRSEERRVGKECRSWLWVVREKEKERVIT